VPEPYATPGAVEAAIKEAARKAAKADPALDVNRRIQLEYFNRFLSRVFAEGSAWLLKGGAGMLARLPSCRATQDIDLAGRGFTLTQGLNELTRLAASDLDDHFGFEYVGHRESIRVDSQPYLEGFEVRFNVRIGGASKGQLKVDLVMEAGVTGEVTTTRPANALDLPRLTSNPYRLYPVVDQVADKVCATMTDYGRRSSSREKDLVDLVVVATTQEVGGTALRLAITTEARRRRMKPFSRFVVPSTWGSGYARLSRSVPYCADHRTVDLATNLVTHFIDPALCGDADRMTWSPGSLTWV